MKLFQCCWHHLLLCTITIKIAITTQEVCCGCNDNTWVKVETHFLYYSHVHHHDNFPSLVLLVHLLV